MKLTVTESEYNAIPAGLYFAEVESLEDTEGKFGPQIQFDMRIVGGEHDGHKLRSWANPTLSTRSKLYRWLKQLNYDLSIGATINVNDLIGQRVLIKVEKQEREDGSEFNKVTELMDANIAQKLQQPKQQPQAASNGDNVDLEALAAQLNA